MRGLCHAQYGYRTASQNSPLLKLDLTMLIMFILQGHGNPEPSVQLSIVQESSCKNFDPNSYKLIMHANTLQSFIYDFRWLAKTRFSLKDEKEQPTDEFELVEVMQPRKLKNELSTLLTNNPRDPVFYKESSKQAKK